MCLIYQKSVSVIKDYNMKRHFEKNHEAYQSRVGEKRTQKIEKLPAEFVAQQLMFKMSNHETQTSSHASYVVA